MYVPVHLPGTCICEMHIACRYTCIPFSIFYMFWNLLGRVFTSNVFFNTVKLLSNLMIYRGFLVDMHLVYDVYFLFWIFWLNFRKSSDTSRKGPDLVFSVVYRNVLFVGTYQGHIYTIRMLYMSLYICICCIYVLTWRTKSSHNFFNPLIGLHNV